ncbi:hypothetical protein KKH27_10380 [bacterium]|nr:hypothetical protein [bacterium]MBU1985465.1 hypothetical protein [bacterium]
MIVFLRLFVCVLLAAPVFAQRHEVIVERKPAPSDTFVMPVDSGPRRFVIDPSQLVYQMKADSINEIAEARVRDLISRLERKFDDPKVEEEIGKLIGEVVMQQQMALLDLQIERAISIRDTLLLKGLEIALEELLINSDVIRNEIMKQLQALEQQATPR